MKTKNAAYMKWSLSIKITNLKLKYKKHIG